jgi:hypothetical protein
MNRIESKRKLKLNIKKDEEKNEIQGNKRYYKTKNRIQYSSGDLD